MDAVIGTGEIEQILAACEGDLSANGIPKRLSFQPYLYHDLTPRILATPRHTAYIKINEGCDHPCTFCVIPQLRGKFRSRRFEIRRARSGKSGRCRRARNFSSLARTPHFTVRISGLRDGLAVLLERLAQVEGLNWVRFLHIATRIELRRVCSIPSRPILAWQNIWTSRCSTPAATFSRA